MSNMTLKTTNSIIVTFNGRNAPYPLSIRNLLEAAQDFINCRGTPGATVVVYDRPIALVGEVVA